MIVANGDSRLLILNESLMDSAPPGGLEACAHLCSSSQSRGMAGRMLLGLAKNNSWSFL